MLKVNRPLASIVALLWGAWASFEVVSLGAADCPPPGWDEIFGDYLDGSKTSFPVDDTSDAGNANSCIFHQWSWEAFVWAMRIEDSSGLPVFLGLKTPPVLVAGGDSSDDKDSLTLKVRSKKQDNTGQTIVAFNQAATRAVIADQTGQAVFYSIHMNDAYADFAQKYVTMEGYNTASATDNFPVGSAVFKAAWRVVQGSESGTDLFTTAATVPVLESVDGGGVAESESTRNVTVGLIGLHVVGVTENHPEFVWGTFEQMNNAPNLGDLSIDSTDSPSKKNFTFYRAGTAAKDCNQQVTVSVSSEADQILSPIPNIFRQYGLGGDSDPDVLEDLNGHGNRSQGEMLK